MDEQFLSEMSWIARKEKYIEIMAMYDSGCGRTAGPESLCSNLEITPSEGSKRGAMFSTANGSLVPARGQRTLSGMLGRTAIDLKFEICAIDKLLVSANELACKGATSFLGHRYGILFLPNGDKVKMEVHNSVYWIRIRLPTSSKVGDEFNEEKMIAMAVEEHKKETLLAATNKKASVQAAASSRKVSLGGVPEDVPGHFSVPVGKKVKFDAAAVAYDYWKKQERQQLFPGHCMERR